ncbi:MAG TPA: hypothetical protein PKG96_05475 [Bacilli bacterium]|nr:hypothetical protein [Bacilli bacterium]
MAVIQKCKNAENGTCKSQYQDDKYGKNMRVFNDGVKEFHCTVCGASGGSIGNASTKASEKK